MNIAILFTGRIDALERCSRLHRENLTGCNGPVHIFYYLEGKKEVIAKDALLGPQGGSVLHGEIVEKSSESPQYRAILDFVMENAPALRPEVLESSAFDRNFFYRSGAILEYFQFMKAYEHMLEYERREGVRFDVVVRSRLDIVLSEPLRIRNFFESLDDDLLRNFGPQVYIQSLGSRTMAERIRAGELVQLFNYNKFEIPDGSAHDVLSIIRESKIMWTMYCNWIWIARRHTMDLMAHFVYRYGALYSAETRHCFNSENQFYMHLNYHNVRLAYYFTKREWDLWDKHELHGHAIIGPHQEWIADTAIVAIVRR